MFHYALLLKSYPRRMFLSSLAGNLKAGFGPLKALRWAWAFHCATIWR